MYCVRLKVDDKGEVLVDGARSEDEDHVVVEDENGSPVGKTTSKWREAAKVLMREQEKRRRNSSPTGEHLCPCPCHVRCGIILSDCKVYEQ